MLIKSGNTTEVNSSVTWRSKLNSPSEWSSSHFSCLYLVFDCPNMKIMPGQWAGAIPACLLKAQTCTERDGCSSRHSFFAVREGGTTLERSLRNESVRYELNSSLLIRIQSYCSTEAAFYDPPSQLLVDLLPHVSTIEPYTLSSLNSHSNKYLLWK